MSRTKKLTRARRHIAELQSKLAHEHTTVREAVAMIVRLDEKVSQAKRDLERVRDKFGPHIAKLVTVTVGVPWQRVEDPPDGDLYRAIAEEPSPMPTLRIISTPTNRDVSFTMSFSSELFMLVKKGHEADLATEVAEQIWRASLRVLERWVR